MINWLKNKTIRKHYLLKLWRNEKDSYLYQTGWIKSFKLKKPVNLEGEPIPWLSLPLVMLLETRLNKTLNIFEYGSGHSTIFFSSKANKVISIEFDKYWFEIISNQITSSNSTLYYFDYNTQEYEKSINDISDEKYDIILIDGRKRVNCCKQSINKVTDSGVIILDDSHRKRYKEGIEMIKEMGFKNLDFWGMGPGSIGNKCSTLFYRSNNCLGI